MLSITEDDVEQAVFGAADGMTSSLGVVIPLALLHQSMLAVVFGLAICATIGMSGGEYLSDSKRSIRSAIAMGLASFTGSVLPALPFFCLPYGPAVAACAVLCAGTGVAISEVNAHKMSRRRAYAQTFGILVAASVATVGFALATGASG